MISIYHDRSEYGWSRYRIRIRFRGRTRMVLEFYFYAGKERGQR